MPTWVKRMRSGGHRHDDELYEVRGCMRRRTTRVLQGIESTSTARSWHAGANGAGKTTPGARADEVSTEGRSCWRPAHRRPRTEQTQGRRGQRADGRHLTGLTTEENLRWASTRVPAARASRRPGSVVRLLPRPARARAQQAGTLSAAEQQMIAIGRALMGKPAYRCSTSRPSARALRVKDSSRSCGASTRKIACRSAGGENAARARPAESAYLLETGRMCYRARRESPQRRVPSVTGE